MRFSAVLAIVAALTVSTPVMPTVADRSVFTRETSDWGPGCRTFCTKSSECCEQVCRVYGRRGVLWSLDRMLDHLEWDLKNFGGGEGEVWVRIPHNVAQANIHVQEGRDQGGILVHEAAGGHGNNLKNGGNFRAKACLKIAPVPH
ncbi:hypothetical protein P692DRAFT_201853970 [Suillus brevipes Sb2]|nr:hypothetical protein P692DRAFT_201853970 [Suillus brevipes Sb2]